MGENYLSADDMIVTDRLRERVDRAPNHATENRVLEALAKELAEHPENLLQKLAETIVDLGIGDSAGISIEEMAQIRQFRWVALAGVWGHLRGSTIPFDASPCGLAVGRDELLLIESPERFFAEARVDPLIHEGLLLPFHIDGRPVGTLWVNAHNPTRKFDAEDARLLKSLARFAAAGFRTVQALNEAQAGKDQLEQRVAMQVAELQASEEKYRTLFENMGQGYVLGQVIRDENGRAMDLRYLELNPAFERLSGIPVVQAQGRTVREVYGGVEPEWLEVADRVARLKIPERVEYEIGAIGRWFQTHFYPAEGDRYLGLYEDVTDRKRAEAALRENGERQAFLLKLSDALRPLDDPVEVQAVASALLGEHLGVSLAYYVAYDAARREATIERSYAANGASSVVGRYRHEQLSTVLDYMAEHDEWIVADVAEVALPQGEREILIEREVIAWIQAVIRKQGDLRAVFCVVQDRPRLWTKAEVALVTETAERTWAAVERARAEATLREREADLTRVQRIGEVGGLDIDVAHGLRSIRSPEYLRLHGLPQDSREESHADWLARLHPEDRDDAEGALFAAMEGDASSYDSEYRIVRPSDGAVRWIHARADIERDASGKAVRLVGAHTDVTEHKQSTEALRESEARLAAAFQSVPVGVAVIDMSGRALLSNAEYRRFLPNGIIPLRDAQNVARWQAWDEQGRSIEPNDWPSARALRGETVVPGQEMLFTGDDGRAIWTNVATAPTRNSEGNVTGIVSVISDIDLAKRAQDALGESAERLSLAIEIGALASWDWDLRSDEVKWNDRHFLTQGYSPGEVTPSFEAWSARVHPEDRAETIALIHRARDHRETYVHDFRSLHPDGEIRWCSARGSFFYDDRGAPCRMIGVMEDITDRKLAEDAIRDSEERFRQFAQASSAALWIRHADTLDMEYVSPAVARIYGVDPDTFLGDVKKWAATIVPEDRSAAFEHIEQARHGDAVVHEFRIQRPSDGAFRWIRNTDFPLAGNGHVTRIGGIAEDITDAKLAVEHQGVLLAELQHRVRNIMAILRSIAARTADGAGSVEEYAQLIAGRLNTFARVQALLTRAANVGVGMETIVNDELRALAAHRDQFEAHGPDVELAPKAAETMTLAVHELATNALKYGALSVPDGKVLVHWEIVVRHGHQWLSFDWNESGAPAPLPSARPRRAGFGSELIEARIPYELKGRGKVRIEEGGAQCHLEFPLQEGASILETGAPQPTTVFGGAIDMTRQADLTGQRILIVEDDYYLASDSARALRGAGAEVIGPCPTEAAARVEMAATEPTCAILDINLRGGRSFDLAGDFMRDEVPFLFITGYDQEVIPDRFEGITRLQKPVEFRHIVEALIDTLALKR